MPDQTRAATKTINKNILYLLINAKIILQNEKQNQKDSRKAGEESDNFPEESDSFVLLAIVYHNIFLCSAGRLGFEPR